MIRVSAGWLAAAAILGTLAVSALPAAATVSPATAAHPRITANPDNLMVNTVTTLTGKGWPANKQFQVMECSRKNWVVPAKPCLTGNAVTVTTNARGSFRAKMTARVCPADGQSGADGFMRVCYVGVPHPTGVDTVHLVGAAKLIVTGP